ncbi:MAG: stage V sporulation protein AD [Oscillospiraceae bacterium]|nr:stage V sporulation protein AD [Oscillospiraceae bacterium]
MNKKIGKQTFLLQNPPVIAAHANVVGKKEGQGPLREEFDTIGSDNTFGQPTWEKAERTMQKLALNKAMEKARITPDNLDLIFAGDLLNQCISSGYHARDIAVPFFGLYGACSTMSESLALASMTLDGGFGEWAGAIASSHFCSAERQYRTPLEYGGQRVPTAQWTATAAGAVVLHSSGEGPRVTHVTVGRVMDKGIKDANNMGAAMTWAAYDTISTHFRDTGRSSSYYDLIVTGDLGKLGRTLLIELFKKDGLDLSSNYNDCGCMLFDMENQDVHCGASGCGCSASVLTGYLLNRMDRKELNRLLFCATGALHSPTALGQGESIPGICHAVAIENKK